MRLAERTIGSVDIYHEETGQVYFSDWESAAEWVAEQGWNVGEWMDSHHVGNEWAWLDSANGTNRGAVYRRKGE